ncbi:MATH and LRR domain-containing protein PFE0570w-like, partial [Sitodiplosis mosellana]|uniref:MATH and LRR domain-containing protein PFE0570w-like n=1 Tax=Sitodiplosis mosellana TaxID=263140 RepID=UPI002444AE7A
MTAGELTEKSDAIKINTFLNAVGEEAIEVFDTLTLTEEQRASYDEVIKAFDEFCKPKRNPVYERFVLNQSKQKEGEPFDAFLMDIKRLARTCEYGDRENEMLRDRIVWGVQCRKLQLRLIEKNELTYDQAVEMARQSESTKEQVNTMSTSKNTCIDEIRHAQNRNARSHVVDGQKSNNNKQRDNRNRNTSSNNNNN